jgi:pyruvate/2-oxoacid:ferredoxin oxidoreductase beta subunit
MLHHSRRWLVPVPIEATSEGMPATVPATYLQVNEKGRGPAWANSLFEDNAQFGLGIAMGTKQRRTQLINQVQAAVATEGLGSPELRATMEEWLKVCGGEGRGAMFLTKPSIHQHQHALHVE